jgi:hypothetical protein
MFSASGILGYLICETGVILFQVNPFLNLLISQNMSDQPACKAARKSGVPMLPG